MRSRLLVVVASLLITGTPFGMAVAGVPLAPPLLSPSSAQMVATACPEAAKYADALVNGISLADANAAAPVLTRCAKTVASADEASVAFGLAAVELAQGVLASNPALIARAANATASLRRDVSATDAQIRTWVLIPDMFDPRSGKAYFDDFHCRGSVYLNAAYIYVAARSAQPWIREPRTPRAQTACAGKPVAGINSPYGTNINIGGNPLAGPPQPQRPPAGIDENVPGRPPGPFPGGN
jgi:hypothetical protein